MASKSPAFGPTDGGSNFYVVGIGASAGGLEALEGFFKEVDPATNCAYIVVTHLDPTHKSMMPELLARHTTLPVRQIENGEEIKPQCVYMIPPNKELAIHDGRLLTIEHAQPRGFRMPINIFFSHLAREYRDRAVAVILSGSGTDGSDSLKMIKDCQGYVLTQTPDEAKYAGMPGSAVASGVVDQVDSVKNLPAAIDRHVRRGLTQPKPPQSFATEPPIVTDAQLSDIVTVLKEKTGHDFRAYKLSTMQRRIQRRVDATRAATVGDYLAHLRTDEQEAETLFNECLINVTRFFRDSDAFDALERQVIPGLVERMSDSTPLRVWIAGCSSGEEAYSIAMLIMERVSQSGKPLSVNMFATDIDTEALATARIGAYPAAQVEAQVSPERIGRFFTPVDRFYKINKSVRDLVVFSQHDLGRNPPLSKVDLICCRNVFIYFAPELQYKILGMFHYSLKPNGYLFLGPSESLGAQDQFFDPVGKKEKLYRKNDIAAPILSRYQINVPHLRLGAPKGGKVPKSAHLPQTPDEMAKAFFLQEDLKPSAIINEASEVLHLSGRAEKFFKLYGGPPSLDIYALVDPGVRTELKATIYSAIRNRKPARFSRVRLKDQGANVAVNILARPLILGDKDTGLTVVTFEEAVDDEKHLGDLPPDIGAFPEELKRILRQQAEELEKSKMVLANVVQDAESTYQELTSSNEELMSTNEELQSTTQELETSREELQSLNEELETVNSELQRKVEDLTNANNDLSNLMVATQIGTLFLDDKLRVKSFTPAAATVFNLILSDVGRPIGHISHHLGTIDIIEFLMQVLHNLTPIEKPVETEDGRHLMMRILPYRTVENAVDGVVVTFVDITKLHSVRTALKESETRMGALLSAIPDALIMLSKDGLVLAYRPGNDGFNVAHGSIIGKPLTALGEHELYVSQNDVHRIVTAVERVFKKGHVEDLEVSVHAPGSRIRTVEVRLASGSDGFAVCVFRDMTDRREAEGLRIAKSTAERVSMAKSEFIANMSHELRTPLNGILGFAEILKLHLAGPLGTEQVEYVENIYASGRQLLQLVNEILDLAKIEADAIVLSDSEFPLHVVVDEVVKSLEPLHACADIVIDQTELMRDLVVKADRGRIRQVLFNLLGNAIKFTPRAGRISIASLRTPDGAAELVVADNGIGIPESYLEKVFDRFEQVKREDGATKAGTGIGLALVKSLVELHGGRVRATIPGLDGKGVAFVVRLPPERACSKFELPNLSLASRNSENL